VLLEKTMRPVPILTAVLVGLFLYLFVMERDFLRTLAGAEVAAAVADAAGEEAAVPPEERVVAVVATRSRARPVDSGLVLRGRTEASRRVEIRAEVVGRVVSEPIRRGAEVAAGDVLCELDPGTRPAQLAEAEARLLEAEANERASAQLAERGFGAEATAIGRRAALQAAQAQVERSRREIDSLEIRAPFTGLLEADTAELGELLQPGSACASVIAIDPIKLVGFVTEDAVERVAVGAPAGARLVTGQEVRGRVTFVARAADPATRTFRVEAEAPNPGAAIRDGISAEILIGLPGAEAHRVPLSALTLDDDGRLGVRTARLEGDGTRAALLPVSIIRDEPGGVWVAGLPEVADVIVVGQDFVTDGQPIRVTLREDAGEEGGAQ
jgi:membrane fusion protein, multidrug efflux system